MSWPRRLWSLTLRSLSCGPSENVILRTPQLHRLSGDVGQRDGRRSAFPFDNVTKRDGVTQAINPRNTVFPLIARGAAQQVNRARLGGYIAPLPSFTGSEAQAEGAGRQERNANHV